MNSYNQAVAYLESQLPMFTRQGAAAFKPGLENITALCAALGNPQHQFPAIHIAGTNGKGSTSHLLAAAFQRNGYKTGLYTSPHLVDLRERFRSDGQMVDREFVVDFINRNRELIETIKPSYFEVNVAMAFQAFADCQVDIAIIETGLGGRLDSTNIIHPLLSIITNIGLEHTAMLGDTLEAIAAEKAGIIKPDTPVLIGETQPETESVFIQKSFACRSRIYFAESLWEVLPAGQTAEFQLLKAVPKTHPEILSFQTDLMGAYQLKNIKTALAATDILRAMGWRMDRELVLTSFRSVKHNTGLRGRWDFWQRDPDIILDVAHNPDGMRYLTGNLSRLSRQQDRQVYILCGFAADKDVAAALALFPKDARLYFTQAAVPRAMPVNNIMALANVAGLEGAAFDSPHAALKALLPRLNKTDCLIITGSFFIVGEAYAALEYLTTPDLRQ